jgi:hypothetical protein
VGRITERAEVGVVRGHDHNARAWRGQPVELFERANYVDNMLDYVDRSNFAKGAVAKWEGNAIEIYDNVRTGIPIAIDTDRARVLIEAAPDV